MVCHLIVFLSLSRLRGNDVASSPDLSGGGCCCNSSQHKIKKNKINNIFPRIGTFLTLRLPVLASKGTLWHSTEMLPPTDLTWPRWDSRAESKMLQLQFSLGLKKKTFLLSESFQRFSRSQITYKLWPDEARSVISVTCSVLFPCVGAKTKTGSLSDTSRTAPRSVTTAAPCFKLTEVVHPHHASFVSAD